MKSMMPQPEAASLRARVFHALEEAILSGKLKPGDTLTEVKLSEQLGVSRTPVREAIGQLEQEGLVRAMPNRGAEVVGVSRRDIEDIYTIRTRIEGLAARWTAEKISGEELRELQNLADLQEFYLRKKDVQQVWQLDSQFHGLIHAYCRSNPLRNTLTGFHHYIARARRLAVEDPLRAAESVEEHREIVEAIAAGDPELAERKMTHHIQMAQESFRRRVDPSKEFLD